MIRLFGPPSVSVAGRPVEPPPTGAFVILALLRRSFGGSAGRSEIATLLAENNAADSAHNALRQLLYRTRKWEAAIGRTVLRSSRTDVWIDETTMSLDLDAFLDVERVRTESELDSFISLYRGEFLAGIDRGSDELKHWIMIERAILFDRFVQVAMDGATRLGGLICERVLDRLETLAPGDRRIVRRREGRSPARVQTVADDAPDHPAISDQRQLGLGSLLDGMARVAVLSPSPGPHALTPTQSLLASSLIEDVRDDLCRLRTAAVIAPFSIENRSHDDRITPQGPVRVDYVARSRVLPTPDATQSCVAISLVHQSSQRLLWAGEYCVGLEDSLVRRSEISAGLAEAILDGIAQHELSSLSAAREPDAYLWYLLARRSMKSLDLRNVRRARNALRKAVELAPGFAPAFSLYSRALSQEWLLLGRADKNLLLEARRFALGAIERDPLDSNGYREMGKAALFLDGAEESAHYYGIAEKISPHHADLLADFADTLCHRSALAAARQRLDLALALNPLAPDEYLWTSGAIDFFQGDYRTALATFMRMREREPASRLISASAAMSGEMETAFRYRDIELENHPDFTVKGWISIMPQDNPHHVERYIEALHVAGFP